MKISPLFLLYSSIAVFSLRSEIIEWDFTTLTDVPKSVWIHSENDSRVAVSRSASVSSPQGTGALKVEIMKPGVRKLPYDIQVSFVENPTITEHKRYRVTIVCKASQSARIEASCFTKLAPYHPFGVPAKFQLEVDETWHERTFEFTGTGISSTPVRIPTLTIGTQSEGFTLWISKVKFEEL